MSKEEAIKIDTVWYNRNPVHEINADTGKDMFDGTMRMCMSEYAEQEAIAFAEWITKNGYKISSAYVNKYYKISKREVYRYTPSLLYQLFKQQP